MVTNLITQITGVFLDVWISLRQHFTDSATCRTANETIDLLNIGIVASKIVCFNTAEHLFVRLDEVACLRR